MSDFAALASACCPVVADVLACIDHELEGGPSDVGDALDEQARCLFGIGDRTAGEQADAVGEALEVNLGFLSAGPEPGALLISRVLDRRRGHPLMLACIGHELARRAGAPSRVHSTADGWLLRFGDAEDPTYVSFGTPPAPGAPVRRHCSHELAFATLTGLEHRYRRCGYLRRARRAERLREQLPIGAP